MLSCQLAVTFYVFNNNNSKTIKLHYAESLPVYENIRGKTLIKFSLILMPPIHWIVLLNVCNYVLVELEIARADGLSPSCFAFNTRVKWKMILLSLVRVFIRLPNHIFLTFCCRRAEELLIWHSILHAYVHYALCFCARVYDCSFRCVACNREAASTSPPKED